MFYKKIIYRLGPATKNKYIYYVTELNLFVLLFDIITLGQYRSWYGEGYIQTENFGERYICTIEAYSLEDAKRIKKKFLG